MAGNFVDVALHGVCAREGQRQRCAFAPGGTDRTEQVGVLVTLIRRLARPRSAFRPLLHEPIFLADARFILEPDFDRRPLWQVTKMRLQRLCEVFL